MKSTRTHLSIVLFVLLTGLFISCNVSPPEKQVSQCSNGDMRCKDNKVSVCEEGSWTTRKDCARDNQVCAKLESGHQCVTANEDCTDTATRCHQNQVEICRDGTWVVEEDCTQKSQTCKESKSEHQCVAGDDDKDDCTDADIRCHQDRIEVCEGGAWVVEEDCAADSRSCENDQDGNPTCAKSDVAPPEIVLEERIFPNAVGFGTESRGAYEADTDPKVLIVDTLDPGNFSTGENRGTLLWALRQDYPRIVVFEVSGVIDYTGTNWKLQIESPFLNIYGQTAPGKGVTVKGAVFWLQTHDVLVQHLKVRLGDTDIGIDPNEMDTVNFYHGSHDVVFDHCSFSWAIDELVGSKETNKNITFSNNIFGEPLDRSWHHDNGMPERHPYGALMYAGNTTFYQNLFAYTFGRNPLIRQAGNHVINNLNYASLHSPTMLQDIGYEIRAAIVGNHIINVPFDGKLSSAGDHAAYVVNNHDPDSELYVEDNLCQRVIDDPSISEWETVYNNDRISQATTSPVDLSDFEILPSSEVEKHVLSRAGAFFWNRDTTDANIVEKVETRAGGQMRHSVDDYPATARNLETTATTGDVSGGYNWADNPQTLVISYNETSGGDIAGPRTLNLTADCENIEEVVDHLNSVLPTGLEAARMNEVVDLNLVEIHTTHAGDGSFIEIHDTSTAADTLGITPGEFHGYSYEGYDTDSEEASLTLPENPHADPDGNSYTNLEEWAWSLGLGL